MKRFECIVCGRKFYQGQGVIISVGQKVYTFHSKSCALKFLRRALEEIDESLLTKAFDNVSREFRNELKERMEKRSKKIV